MQETVEKYERSLQEGKKEEKGTTGSVAKKKRAIYWERLRFLDVVEDERNTFTNVPTDANNVPSTSIVETDFVNLEGSEEGTPIEQMSDQSSRDESSLQSHTGQTPTVSESQGSDGAAFQPPKSKRRQQNGALNKYLQEKKDDREHFKRCLEELLRPVPQKDDDENDMFFKTVAATVKKFRPDLATRTKAKMFEILTEMELLNQQPPHPHYYTGFTNIRCDDNQMPYSSSASPSWTTPITSRSEASNAASDIVHEAFAHTFQDESADC